MPDLRDAAMLGAEVSPGKEPERVPVVTGLDLLVLDACCESLSTRNAVVLTEALVSRGAIKQYGDPFGLVCSILETLNDDGLLKYRLGDYGVPIQIRVLPIGYHAAGYAVRARQVNQPSLRHRYGVDDASRHPGDGTDYRNFKDRTTGGPTEELDVASHLAKYAGDHVERFTGYETAQGEDDMAKKGPERKPRTFITPEMGQRIITLSEEGVPAYSIANMLGLSESGVRNRLSALHHANGNSGQKVNGRMVPASLRSRILDYIEGHPGCDSTDISDAVGQKDLHSVQHILWSLQQQGRVSFVERKTGSPGGGRMVANITLTKHPTLSRDDEQAAVAALAEALPAETQEAPEAPSQEDQQDEPSATPIEVEPPAYEAPAWPQLDQLRARRALGAISREKAQRLMAAAELLDEVGDEQPMVEALIARANDVAQKSAMSPIEDEYIRFADEADREREDPR